MKLVIIGESTLMLGSLVGLGSMWYANESKSSFHLFDDEKAWLQMDKVGHLFSAYNIGYYSMQAMDWASASKKNQLLYGASLGFVFLGAVEVMDGFSKEWGFSLSDLAANFGGTALLVGQELAFDNQIIRLKYSYHKNALPDYRREVLGKNFSQQLIKDYNGQTYWASINLRSMINRERIPTWLNLAIGYGASGMLHSENNLVEISGKTYQLNRYRQYYLSLDIALEKIKSRKKWINGLLHTFSVLKVPLPTVEYSSRHGLRSHLIYF